MPVPKLEAIPREKYKKRQSYKHLENITRSALISTGKNGKRRSHKYWENNKRQSHKNWEKYGKRRSHKHWENMYIHTYTYIYIYTSIHIYLHAYLMDFRPQAPTTMPRQIYLNKVCGAGVTRLRDQSCAAPLVGAASSARPHAIPP